MLPSLLVGLILGTLILFAIGLALTRRQRRAGVVVPTEGTGGTKAPTPPWLWMVVMIGMVAILLFEPGGRGRRRRPRVRWPVVATTAVVVPSAVVGWVLLAAWAGYRRQVDPGVQKALRRANEGDVAGGVADLREEIEVKGPSPERLNALAVLLATREDWAEALRVFEQAETLYHKEGKPVAGQVIANKALTLGHLGRGEEALELLDEAAGREPTNYLIPLYRCRVLVRLNRPGEAVNAYRRAEALARQLVLLTSRARRQFDESLTKDRERLEQALGHPLDG